MTPCFLLLSSDDSALPMEIFLFQIAGRQDYRGRDLRERLDRRHSPLRGYSLERDSRARHVSHGKMLILIIDFLFELWFT